MITFLPFSTKVLTPPKLTHRNKQFSHSSTPLYLLKDICGLLDAVVTTEALPVFGVKYLPKHWETMDCTFILVSRDLHFAEDEDREKKVPPVSLSKATSFWSITKGISTRRCFLTLLEECIPFRIPASAELVLDSSIGNFKLPSSCGQHWNLI